MTFWQTLCHFKKFCGKRRSFKMRALTVQKVEKQLDIRSLMSVGTNLSHLVSLFLTKEQILLFKHSHRRTLTENKDRGETSDDDLPNLNLKVKKVSDKV